MLPGPDAADPTGGDPSTHPPPDDLSVPPGPAPEGHEPVLLRDTLDALNLRPSPTILDCTLGRRGHSSAIAPQLGPERLLLAIDADPRNLEFARARVLASGPR